MKIKTYSFYALVLALMFIIQLQSSAQRNKKILKQKKKNSN